SALFLLAVCSPAHSGIVIIDDFNDPVQGSGAVAGTGNNVHATSNVGGLSNAIGGARDQWAFKASGGTTFGHYVAAGEGGNAGVFDQSGTTDRGVGIFRWDGTAAAPTQNTPSHPVAGNSFSSPGFAPTDLFQGTNFLTFRKFTVATQGGNGPLMTVTLNTTSGHLSYSELLQPTTSVTKTISYLDFLGSGNYTSVIGIEVFFDGRLATGAEAGADVEFSFLQSAPGAPEPSSIVLALTSIGGLAFVRKWKKRSGLTA
ncbi:MAG: PEP-CTERM sorting domain-containing protein, partial [Planctomycetota bacterium]|nr:PEP-CTERM sorting domain-containing protein [Planctomycetota bacterium]